VIAGGAAVAVVLYLAFGHGSSKPSSAAVAPQPAGATAPAPPDAPAPAVAAAASGGNPIFGQWTLVDTDQAANCQTSQEFDADSATAVRGGVTSTGHPIYNVQATFVDVSYGGPNFEQWDVNGPNDLTLDLINPYGMLSCRYHRA